MRHGPAKLREKPSDGQKRSWNIFDEETNHEGYHDPTAGKAIRRAHRAKRRNRGSKMRPLICKVGDLQGFPVILK